MTSVSVYVDGTQDLTHPSYLYAGLGMLAHAGEIELELKRLSKSALPRLAPGNVFTQAEVRDGARSRRVLFDFKDQNDVFCDELLEQVDVYFKRSYLASEVAKRGGKRVLPLGMPFACRFQGELGPIIAETLFSPRPGESLKSRLLRIRQYLGIDYARTFTAYPPAKKLQRVIFQTRLWEKHEVANDDLDGVNLPRVSLLRRLRKELGDRFLGGLVPTARALRDFPELVREEGVKRHEYLALMRPSAIGISTRGLFHSTPWKLSEYLSTGMAVISQPITNQPLEPLVDGEHLLLYGSEDECVSHCVRLLENAQETARLQRAARDYYERAVDPMATVRRLLREAIAQ
jgi:hypothetical protein